MPIRSGSYKLQNCQLIHKQAYTGLLLGKKSRLRGRILRVAKVAQADANQAKPLVWSEAMQLRIVHRHCRAIKPIG